MAVVSRSARGRLWANALAIIAVVLLAAMAIWPGEPTASEEASAQLESAQLVWVLHGVGGLLAPAPCAVRARAHEAHGAGEGAGANNHPLRFVNSSVS